MSQVSQPASHTLDDCSCDCDIIASRRAAKDVSQVSQPAACAALALVGELAGQV